jgi:hypothetical protein
MCLPMEISPVPFRPIPFNSRANCMSLTVSLSSLHAAPISSKTLFPIGTGTTACRTFSSPPPKWWQRISQSNLGRQLQRQDFFKTSTLNFNETEEKQVIYYTLQADTAYLYFSLMLVDRNRKASYSQIRKINTYTGKNRIQLAGNPVRSQMRLYTTNSRQENVQIQVFNSAG